MLTEVIEQKCREDGSNLAGCGGNAVSKAPNPRRECFSRDDEGCDVGTKIEKELSSRQRRRVGQKFEEVKGT